jgi:hypothetical protein
MAAGSIRRRETESELSERTRPQHQLLSSTQLPADPTPSRSTSRTAQAPAEAAPLATAAGQSRDAEEEDHQQRNHQKRTTEHRWLLPSLPQPAREAQTANCARRKPPQPPRPHGRNGGGRGRTTPRNADSTATVLDAASRALTPNLHLTSRRRRTGVPPLSRRRSGRRRGKEPPAWPAARWGTQTRLLIACYSDEREDMEERRIV